MKSLKYIRKNVAFIVVAFFLQFGCAQKTIKQKTASDWSKVRERLGVEGIMLMQEDVNKKRPYQGSLLHQSRCDTLIALGHNVSDNYQEKSTPYTKIGDYHIAYPFLEKAYQLDPEGSLYYYSWLTLYYYRDYERAFALLTEYDDYTPGKATYAWGENVNFLKGLALRQMKRYTEAIVEFSTYIKDEGHRVDIYTFVYKGICHFHSGDSAFALKDFDYTLEKYESCSAAYFWKAEVLAQKQEYKEAIRLLEIALDLVKKGHIKTDPYMELFDMPNQMQIEDRIKEIEGFTH
ncbi:MAG: tetratricopeptide repeat protein [Saprospiraceae bacterium]|nr:tetratricopeptide repeat protein [Saprospiraceae bacterium]